LHVYCDDWKVLNSFKDVLDDLAALDGKDITDVEFLELLKKRGFRDLTHYDNESIGMEVLDESTLRIAGRGI
jgi:hypothetical protein